MAAKKGTKKSRGARKGGGKGTKKSASKKSRKGAKKSTKKAAKKSTKKGGGKGTKKRAGKTSSTASPAAVEGYTSPETSGAEVSGMEEGAGGESEAAATEGEE